LCRWASLYFEGVARLEDCDLGYPALAPLISYLKGSDELTFARFYSAPPNTEPFKGQWLAFRWANRHIEGLDFFQGYRNSAASEKAIDVALAVDFIARSMRNAVPVAHRAPSGHSDITAVLTGALAKLVT
jgi:hypothetical protein